MFDDFASEEKTHIPEPELVPILDALTAVIFFLLLSVTFIDLTKITVPPSQTSVITSPVRPPPRTPKLFVKAKGDKINLGLFWTGDKPDNIKKTLARKPENARSPELETAVNEMVKKFKEQYPDEKTLQLGLTDEGTYQELLSAMDGVLPVIQDIVLISSHDMAIYDDRER